MGRLRALLRRIVGGGIDRPPPPIVALGLVGSLGNAANQALVPDLLPPERHEAGYAAVRMMQNFGVTIGPPLGGLLLLGQNWTRFFSGAAAAGVVPLVLAVKLIPHR